MSLFERSSINRFSQAQAGVRGMRIFATAMLVAMAAVYLVANRYDEHYILAGYIKAFAEAAMVGGLADWFAVTALFRHPLGLPIPHTAIIPRNKDRIGATLAQFLRDNFLTPAVVVRRMRGLDVAGAAGRFLERPPGEGRLREGISRLVVDIVESLDQDQLGGLVKSAVSSRLLALEISPLLGHSLEAAINDDRHMPILDGIITWAGRTLDANEEVIRAMVHDRTSLIVRLTGMDEKIADSIVDGLRRLMIDMAIDPYHPLRAKAEEGLAQLAWDMRYDPAMRAKVEAWKNQIIENKAVTDWVSGVWEAARSGLLKAARDPDAVLAGKFGEALRQLGETLQRDMRLKGAVNQFARRAAVGVVARYGDTIVTLVSDTIRGWDARTVTDRLEAAVGRDLQYIRINGTLVGGLVGLLIHAIEIF